MLIEKCRSCKHTAMECCYLFQAQIYFFIFILLVLSSANNTVVNATQKKCHSDFDCSGLPQESCCVAVTKMIGICKPRVPMYGTCFPHAIKFIRLYHGGIARNMCGCQKGFICRTIERKNWRLKKNKWSKKKKKRKTKFKHRCRSIPMEAVEFQELHR